MKIKVLQENFSRALSVASRFISPKAQLPILGNVLLQASKTRLIIASTNLEVSASISIGAQIEKEGELAIPGRVLSEIISNLSSETINLEAEKEQLKIKTSKFSSNVLGMNAADFPKIPHVINRKTAIIFDSKSFSEAVSSVIFAASIDETRPTLTGVLFVFGKDVVSLVATDGFRLSQKKLKTKNSVKSQQIILPRSVLFEFSKNNQEGKDIFLEVNQTEKQAIFGIEDSVFSSRVIEGEFPSFEKIIPKASSTKITLDKEELSKAIKIAGVFAREAANIVKLQTGKDEIKVSAESASAGSQETKIEAKVEGVEVEIAFNFRFLEEFLHAAKGEAVQIALSGGASPAVFTDPEDPDFLHLIMPVRIQG